MREALKKAVSRVQASCMACSPSIRIVAVVVVVVVVEMVETAW
jgi:hypothetical protein